MDNPLPGRAAHHERKVGEMESIKKFKLNFTQVPNVVLKDKRLSLKAKGLYAYLFSKPDGWHFNPKIIIKEIKEGRDAFYAAMKELVDCGYVCRHQQNANGKFGGSVYKFVDPTIKPRTEKPCAEKPYTGNPYPEKPYTENPDAGTYITNTEITNTEINNNINNIINNNMRARARCWGGQITIGPDFEIDFQDEIFQPYCLAKGEIAQAVQRWIIKNKCGKTVDKAFICKQIVNFATRQGKIKELLG